MKSFKLLMESAAYTKTIKEDNFFGKGQLEKFSYIWTDLGYFSKGYC